MAYGTPGHVLFAYSQKNELIGTAVEVLYLWGLCLHCQSLWKVQFICFQDCAMQKLQ